jgi:glutaredoxin
MVFNIGGAIVHKHGGADDDFGSIPNPTPRRDNFMSNVITALIIILIILILAYWLIPKSLSKRLKNKGWWLYTMQGCHHCTREKKLLDYDFDDRIVECDGSGNKVKGSSAAPIACSNAKGFPFWINTKSGDTKVGYQNLAELELMST